MSDSKKLLDLGKQIFDQEAQALLHIASILDDHFVYAVNMLHQCKGRIILSGIGKSAIIAQKIAATFNSTGSPALFLHAAEAIHGDLGMIQKDDIIIILSKSGDSPEIKNLISIIASWENKIIGITCNSSSFLAQNAHENIILQIGNEACKYNLAPTTSTTAQLVTGDALAIALMEQNAFSKEDFARLHPGGNLGKRLLLTLADIYTHNASPKVYLQSTLKEIISTISQGRLGAVCVVDDTNKVLGIITDGDIRRLLEKVDDIKDIKAKDFYTSNGYTETPETLAVKGLEIMKLQDITQLIIVDNDKNFLGFVHLHDLVEEGLS